MSAASVGFVRGSLERLSPAALAFALLVGLAACSGGDAGSNEPGASPARSNSLLAALQRARENPEDRDIAETECNLTVAWRGYDEVVQAFFSGILDVPDERAWRAFCAALVEGSVAGEVTEADLENFSESGSERSYKPLGDLLRKLIVAHERLQGQQAQRRPAVNAEPSS